MIISASRRTDIPAFYAEWMVRRLREGYCTVANPFNRNQVTRISLKPEDVDAIVFWTRNPRPLLPYLDELDSRGYRYYFQFTILGYPREIDPSRLPPRPPSRRSASWRNAWVRSGSSGATTLSSSPGSPPRRSTRRTSGGSPSRSRGIRAGSSSASWTCTGRSRSG